MIKKALVALSALTLVSATLTGCATASGSVDGHDELHFSDGWVRVSEYSDHVDGMTGAFATIENHTDHDVTLVGGSAEIANMVEVHEVVMIDKEMKMQAKDGGIVIKAGESVTLEPGGLHVMLMGLKKPILEGDEVTLTLDFEGYDDQTFTWPAKASLSGDETYEPKK
jgi:periplasmic copper chaperone A